MQESRLPTYSVPPSLPVYLAERLAHEIETNVLKPNERLSEEAIAKRFGVSRAPVREALRLLAQDEIVIIEARRGARVRSYSREELTEMFEMRAVLYGLSIELFTQRTTPELFAIAEQLGRKIIASGNARNVSPESFAAATQAFTTHAVGNCGNVRLIETLRKMTRRSFRHFAILAHSTPAHRKLVAGYVRRMLDAMAQRDPRAAGNIARELVDRNHAEVLRHLAAAEGGAA
jgi:DNA-binding GntR family transcriptional regulator